MPVRRSTHGADGVLASPVHALQPRLGGQVAPDKPHVTFRATNSRCAGRGRPSCDLRRDPDADESDQRPVLRLLPDDEALSCGAPLCGRRGAALRRAVAGAAGGASQRQRIVSAHGRGRQPVRVRDASDLPGGPGLRTSSPRCVICVGSVLGVRPDLVDRERRIVRRGGLVRVARGPRSPSAGCRRYDLLVADDWTVLRFTWEDVMYDQDWVRSVLTRWRGTTVRALPDPRTDRTCCGADQPAYELARKVFGPFGGLATIRRTPSRAACPDSADDQPRTSPG